MEIFEKTHYSRALVVGAGSGRDMASAVLVTEQLRREGVEVDLAGFLSPWALHTFDGALERPVNELTGKESRKFVISRKDDSLDSYFEPELVKLNKELDLGIGRFYLFSLHYGTEGFREALEDLVGKNAYDAVVAVDVGGDILARKEDLPSILTPIVDFSCLSILAGLDGRIDRRLIVMAPGVDGELARKNLLEIFDELEQRGLVLGSEVITEGSPQYEAYKRVGNRLNARTSSRSNTFRLIQKAISSRDASLSGAIEKRFHLKERAWRLSLPVEIAPALASKLYHFHMEPIQAVKKEMGLPYGGILEAFVKFKVLGAGATEVDLACVPLRVDGGEYRGEVLLLTLPERLQGEIRKEILQCGLEFAARGEIAPSIILKKDIQILDLPSDLEFLDVDGFCVVGQEERGGLLSEVQKALENR
jgi:hypothetical protein